MEDGSAFLLGFVERYNAKFTKAPAKPDNLHRALNIEPDRLTEVFCLRDKRYVTKDLTLKYDRKRIRLEVNELTRGLVGKYVDVYEMRDGLIQVRAKGVALPCSIFDPNQQRVTHAAITENKHLSAVLAYIKKEQEKAASQPTVKPASALEHALISRFGTLGKVTREFLLRSDNGVRHRARTGGAALAHSSPATATPRWSEATA
ncbi:hypothetical protein GCM10011452_33950 [Gemmobacter lanyuensis]|uniref:Uncharacterized protein n=1 Tax=Gemmobacter lanyuensis TaxID=1054497 RepID=A0A918MNX4_9RHOB|nr:hypothetical protein GCM10011452_33950 [Gemmobacter lanyuensis]